MAIQKFTLEAIQKVRSAIQAEFAAADPAQLPIWSEAGAEIPEPESLDDLSDIFTFGGRSEAERTAVLESESQWFVSPLNPASVLLKLPGLWLKPNYRLVSYQHRAVPKGARRVFALPEALSTTAHLQKALASKSIADPPQPEGAMPHVMAAISGDRSPASFIVASILMRELQALDAIGNPQNRQQNWSHHRLIQALPNKLSWKWRTEIPKDWLPKASVMPDGQAGVEFFSCRLAAQAVVLYRHLDRYPTGGYQPTCLDKGLAVGTVPSPPHRPISPPAHDSL